MKRYIFLWCVLSPALYALPDMMGVHAVTDPVQQLMGAGKLMTAVVCGYLSYRLTHLAIHHASQAHVLRGQSVLITNIRGRAGAQPPILQHEQAAFQYFACATMLAYGGYYCAQAGMRDMGLR